MKKINPLLFVIKNGVKYRGISCDRCTMTFGVKVGSRNWTRAKYCSVKCRNQASNRKYAEQRKEWQIKKADAKAINPSPDKIQCLLCSRYYVQLGTHIVQRHNMTAREYRKLFGYNLRKGQLPEGYREEKRASNKKNWPKIKNNLLVFGASSRFVMRDPKAGKYQRQPETLENLRNLYKKTKKYENLHNRPADKAGNSEKSDGEASDKFWQH